jgi:exonuclease VII small subunit
MDEPPIANGDDIKLKESLNSFYISNLSIGMAYYNRGHNKLAKVCNQVLNLIQIHSQLLSQDSRHLFTDFILTVLPVAAMPHLKRGTAVVRHCRNLTDR